jgi:hypothetical protein
MRDIIAVALGIVTGVFFIMTGETVIHTLFPVDKTDIDTIAGKEAFMDQVPFMARLLVIIGWAIAGFAGSAVTSFIQGRTSFKIPLATIGVLQLLAWMNMIMIPHHPVWMWVTGSLVFIIPGYFAYYCLRKKPVDHE